MDEHKRNTGKKFLVISHKNTSDILVCVIHQWILRGTTLKSDCMAADGALRDEKYARMTVCHSMTFLKRLNHSNTFEWSWKYFDMWVQLCLADEKSSGIIKAKVLWKPHADPRGCTFICFGINQRFAFRLHYQSVCWQKIEKKWPWVEISEIYRLYLTIGKIWKYENISCSCCERAGARTLQAEGPKTKIWYKEYVVVVLVVVVVVVLLLLLLLLILILILQTLQLHYLKVGIRGNEVNI